MSRTPTALARAATPAPLAAYRRRRTARDLAAHAGDYHRGFLRRPGAGGTAGTVVPLARARRATELPRQQRRAA